MVVTAVDHGLEELLRTELPLPSEIGDISFDPPDRTWGAQLSRLTVNLFLFEVARSELPPRPPAAREGDDGRLERLGALPMARLHYLVTAWAGSIRDEHQLLGDVLTRVMLHKSLPTDYLNEELPGPAYLTLAGPEARKPNELWSALDGRLKPSFQLQVHVPLPALDWTPAPPLVTRVEGLAAPVPTPAPPPSSVPEPGQLVRRRAGASVVTEGRPDQGA